MPKQQTMPKKPKYKLIDLGNPSESRGKTPATVTLTRKQKEAIYEKILAQIPEGKTMVFTESTFKQPSNKALVEIIDPEDIPPTRRPRNQTKATLIKAGFKHIIKTDETNGTKPKHKKRKQ
jgi:hypothetical protein